MNDLRLNRESGNVLWFILLAVALLGLLTMMLNRSASTVEQTGNVEKSRIKASALMRYGKSIETAIQQMLSQGISESDLDFVALGAAYDNTNCTTAECEIFNREGGGISYRTAAQILGDSSFGNNWVISSGNRIYHVGCDTQSAECTDLLLLLPNVPKSVCLQINAIEGITNPSGDAPQQNEVTNGTGFKGDYSAVNLSFIGGTNAANESPQVAGKTAGCVYEFGGGQNTYYFYYVLLGR